MPLKDRLRKLAQVAAVGTTMFAPAAFAQDLEKPPVPIEQSANRTWQNWDKGRFSEKQIEALQKTYDSLPDKYKAFSGKDFKTRFSMKEEYQQRLWKHLSAQHPNEEISASLSTEMEQDKLTIEQKNMVEDLVYLGRPSETLDKTQPLDKQLSSCGFDKVSKVVNGANPNDFSFEEQGEFAHQMVWSNQVLNENPRQKAELKKYIQETKNNEEGKTTILDGKEMPQISWTKVNGSEIQDNPLGLSAAGSYSRQTVLDVSEKLKQSDKSQVVSQAISNKLFNRN